MNQVGLGRTAEFFEIDDKTVLKLFHKGMPPEMAEKEYKINRLLSGKVRQMPGVIGKTDKENRSGLIFQRICGINLASYMLKNPLKLPSIMKSFSELHKEINEITINPGRKEIDSSDALIGQIKNDPLIENKDTIISFITSTDRRQLCHGDFHPENIMIDAGNQLWIIDWPTAWIGNSCFDVARTYYLLRYGQSPNHKAFMEKQIDYFSRIYIAGKYLKYRITDKLDSAMFQSCFYLVLLLRRNEGIKAEKKILERLIKKERTNAVQNMKQFIALSDAKSG